MNLRFARSGLLTCFAIVLSLSNPNLANADDLSLLSFAAYLCDSVFSETGQFSYSVSGEGEATASTKAEAENRATDLALEDCLENVEIAQDNDDIINAEKCRNRGYDYHMGESDFWCELHPSLGLVQVSGCIPSYDKTQSNNLYCERIGIDCSVERTVTASDILDLYGIDSSSGPGVITVLEKWTCRALANGGVYHNMSCGVEFTIGGQNESCDTSGGTTINADPASAVSLGF